MPTHNDIVVRLDVKVPMRDQTPLSTDLYRPGTSDPVPTILMRTPYSNNLDASIATARRYANHGYACAIQDCRGRWDSNGDYYPFREGADGYDTQQWIGQQGWSNGKIGMAGGSYLGAVQWTSAPHNSPHLTCMAPRVICCDYRDGLVFPGGAFQLNVMMTWGMRTNARTGQNIDFHHWNTAFHHLPMINMDEAAGRDLNFWKDWIRHPEYSSYWEEFDDEQRFGTIAAPALNMGGWYDLYAAQTFTNFNGLRLQGGSSEAKQSKLIVGPWPHALSVSTRTGDIDFGAHSLYDLDGAEMRWFDYWLKGIDNGIVDEPPIELFIMGINKWRSEWEWPLARTEWRMAYFDSGGRANSVIGDGHLSFSEPHGAEADHFTYDPRYPVQTLGGNNCCSPHIVPWGPYDQRPAEMRGDVLCYTSDPLAQDLEVTGPIQVVLYAATDGRDTDWTAKLVDVAPSGYAMNLCDGIIRSRYREDRREACLLEPGTVYEYTIEVGVTGNVFRKGHRIRVDISSSNFPRFDRNPNTGNKYGIDAELRPAQQTVFHSKARPSHIRLPVIPAANHG